MCVFHTCLYDCHILLLDECDGSNNNKCTDQCSSTKRLGELFLHKTCPLTLDCRCTCTVFNESNYQDNCQSKWMIFLPGATNRHGCLDCQCTCAPFHEDVCEKQCETEGKGPINGAKSIYCCPICQCDCSSRNCGAECPGYKFKVERGDNGCITKCSCICPPLDCAGSCRGRGRGTVITWHDLGCPAECGECRCPDLNCDSHCRNATVDDYGCATNCETCDTIGKTDTYQNKEKYRFGNLWQLKKFTLLTHGKA